MQLAGSVAMITGGASGLGAATARLFSEAGANLVLCDLNTEAGSALAAEFGHNGLFVKTDVTRILTRLNLHDPVKASCSPTRPPRCGPRGPSLGDP